MQSRLDLARSWLLVFISVYLAVATKSTPSHEECAASYGKPGFLPEHEARQPPMLLTFPGSGTTMTAMLIEYATGINSGSIYGEDDLYDAMPGLRYCSSQQSIVKVHANDFTWQESKQQQIIFTRDEFTEKCSAHGVNNFDRFIIVVRNPWASFWSNYQRAFAFRKKMKQNGHTGGLRRKDFDNTNKDGNDHEDNTWRFNLLHGDSGDHGDGIDVYNDMWSVTLSHIFHLYDYHQALDVNFGNKTFHLQESELKARKQRKAQIKSMQNTPSTANVFHGNKNVLLVRYEDLINMKYQMHVLRIIVNFIGIGYVHMAAARTGTNDDFEAKETKRRDAMSRSDEEERRLQCAFILTAGASDVIKRNTTTSKSSDLMTTRDAYADKELVCDAWNLLQRSAPQLQRYGYYNAPMVSSSSHSPLMDVFSECK